jgi:phosphatidate phosphatase APP1
MKRIKILFRYPALRCFLEEYKYPMGTMNLRKFAWSLKFLKPPETYKIEIITQIINSYPLRKYICVGDSGLMKKKRINHFEFFLFR